MTESVTAMTSENWSGDLTSWDNGYREYGGQPAMPAPRLVHHTSSPHLSSSSSLYGKPSSPPSHAHEDQTQNGDSDVLTTVTPVNKHQDSCSKPEKQFECNSSTGCNGMNINVSNETSDSVIMTTPLHPELNAGDAVNKDVADFEGFPDSPECSKQRKNVTNSRRTFRTSRMDIRENSSSTCNFTDTQNVHDLLKLSEDLRFFKWFYVLHTKCSGIISKSFGPWCSKVTSKRSRHSDCLDTPCSRASKDSSTLSTKESKTDRLRETSPTKTNLTKEKNGDGRDSKSNPKEKTPKVPDVYDRLSGQAPPYVFRHRADIRGYMSEYREQYTVGLVCRKVRKYPVLGVDVPDPYSCKKKKPCTCIECSPMSQAKMAASAREGVAADGGSGKDGGATDRALTRPVPNLAPVREKKVSNSDKQSLTSTPKPQTQTTEPPPPPPPSNTADSTPSLSLPSLPPQKDCPRLALIGYSPANGAAGNQVMLLPTYSPFTTDEDSLKNVKSKARKKRRSPIRLKYTNRPPNLDASEETKASHDVARKEPDSSSMASSSKDAVVSQPMTISVPIPTARMEEGENTREPLFPGIVRKGTTMDSPNQKEMTFYRGRHTNLAQKIYESKLASLQETSGKEPRTRSVDEGKHKQTREKRSRSVDVFPGVKDKSKTKGGKKGGFLSVRVMSVDSLPVIMGPDKNVETYFTNWKHPKNTPLPRISDPQLSSKLPEETGIRIPPPHSVFLLEQSPQTTSQTNGEQTTDRSKGSPEETSNKPTVLVPQPVTFADPDFVHLRRQKDFAPRSERDKNTSIKISQTQGGNSESSPSSETIGVRGKTIIAPGGFNTSTDLNGESPSTTSIDTHNISSPTKKSQNQIQPPEVNHSFQNSVGFPAKRFKRQNTFGKLTLNQGKPDNHGDKTEAQRKSSNEDGLFLSSVGTGPLFVKGDNAVEVHSGPKGDGSHGEVSDCPKLNKAGTVIVDYRVSKNRATTLDKQEPVVNVVR